MADHLYTYDDPPSERDLARTVRNLADDGVIAYPTDLNWAFGCDATSPKAIERIRALKPGHPRERPFSLIVSSISMAAEFVNIDSLGYRLLKKAWPGPFTVLLSANRNFPRQLKDKRHVVGIRIPRSALVLALIEKLGRPLATAGVPKIGDMAPHFGHEVFEEFGHALDLVLDLGSELSGLETTIIDLTQGYPEIVRLGAGNPALFEISS